MTDVLIPNAEPTSKTTLRSLVAASRVPAAYPAVTIVLDFHNLPKAQTQKALQAIYSGMIKELGERLHCEGIDESKARTLIKHVKSAESVALQRQSDGITSAAVLVDINGFRIVDLDIPTHTRLVVDDTFATRDIVRSQQLAIDFLALSLGGRSVVFRGSAKSLQPMRSWAFSEDKIGLEERDRHDDKHYRRRMEYRLMTNAIDEILNELPPHIASDTPLLVAGSARRTKHFQQHSQHRERITAILPISGEDLYDEHALLGRLRPCIDELRNQNAEHNRRRVEAVRGTDRFVSGLEACWVAAVEGAIDTLVVENDFRQPARTFDDLLQLQLVDDAKEAGAIDDLVDELIEHVIGHGGHVAVVERTHGTSPIAARLRRPATSLAVPLST